MGGEVDQFRVWNDIAASFDGTRERTWDHVDAFVAQRPPGPMLDLMAGNGRHSRAVPDAVAADWSLGLLQAAGGGVRCDATRLPFADDAFAAAIYVAGLHGIPDPAGRAASLSELRRVLSPGAPAQITVWSRDAPRFSDAIDPDVVVPWRAGGHDAARTYHLYSGESLLAACEGAGFREVVVEPIAIAAPTPDNLVATVRA